MTDDHEPQVDDAELQPSSVADQRPPVLELLVDLQGLPDDLSESTVPLALMEIPIAYAGGWLDEHRRNCPRLNTCEHTPRSLRRLLKMHSRDAILKNAAPIHAELWRQPDVTMIAQVRDRIIQENDGLVSSLRTWDPSGVEKLHAELRDGAHGVPRIAAVLWALGLSDPRQRELFRLLPTLLRHRDETAPPVSPPVEPQEPSEKERHKRKRQAAETRVRELEKEVAGLKTDGRERAKQLSQLKQELERTEKERGAQHQLSAQLQEERDDRVADVRELQRQLDQTARDARRSREAGTRLRADLEALQTDVDQLERDRRRLTRELAVTRTRVESIEAALDTVPRGTDAIASFLEEEEERIDQALVIEQGAGRQRAEGEHSKRERLEAAFREAYPEYVPPPPTALGAPRTLRFTALGGGAEVGRSAYLIEIGSSRILVDCGIAVGRTDPGQMIPDLADLGRLDALVLTHAHTDHIGWVPALVRAQGPEMPIYCSVDTAAITPIMLEDARANYERLLARQQQIAAHNPDAVPMTEQYTWDDLYDVETRFHALRYDDPHDLPGTALKLSLYPAGHILGAASVVLVGGGRTVVVSGDISSEPQATVGPASPPRELSDVDLLILESTYGGRVRNAEEARGQLIDFVEQATRDGTAILPCFALGRGQEVLQLLLRARRDGALDPAVTIWVDGLIRRIIPVYTEREKLEPAGFQQVERGERAWAIAQCQRPDARAVVVTTSGMLNGGPVMEWAQALLPDPRHRIALLGYQDEESGGGSLGRQLRRGGRPPYELVLSGEEGEQTRLRIAGPIREIGLSAHADENGLVEFARAIGPRRIALVHGDPEAQSALRRRLTREMPETETLPPGGDPVTIT